MNALCVGESMDLFLEIFGEFKDDFWLWRIVRIALDKGVEIKIYSDEDLIVIQKAELDQVEWAYLMAAKSLVEWLERNYDHASSSTRKGDSHRWMEKLKEQLGLMDEVDSATEGNEVLSMPDI